MQKSNKIQIESYSQNLLLVEQSLRCFMVPVQGKSKHKPKLRLETQAPPNPLAEQLTKACHPFGGICLIFDTETFQFKHGQSARFGSYQLRGISQQERLFRWLRSCSSPSAQTCTILQAQARIRHSRRPQSAPRPYRPWPSV